MPPRRSSRTSNISVDLDSLPAKRKRGQSIEPDAEEKENVAKPSSRTRRGSSVASSVVPASKTRKSTRSKTSLPEVPESENEQESDSPRPIKKSRPSTEHEINEQKDEDEDEEHLETKPKRSRIKAPRQAALVQSDEDEDDAMAVASDDSSNAKPTRRGRKAKTPAPAKSHAKSKKALPKVPKVEPEDADVDLAGPSSAQPSSSHVQKARESTGQPSVVASATPEAEEEEEEERSLFDPPPMPAPSSLPQTMPEAPTGPKARLVIHKMALVNFKSYAGRQEIGPFHKSFSSIVGPNGSGKSNTIDALLFVFGYRASKMRQGKISELIHTSANYPDLDECIVEIHFREIVDLPGPDDYTVVPDSQLVVTRSAYKSNASKYTINGRTSNYKEVQTLLKGRGIDLDHNRFLILQGEVESIAQMKPKAPTEHEDGLLEYLEDIIGTSKYKEPIDEAMVEVERLQEERQIKLNRLRHVEKEKQALQAKKKEAEDYLRLMNEYVKARSRLFQFYIFTGMVSEQIYEDAITKIRGELAKETEKNKVDIDYFDSLTKHYEEREKAYVIVQAAAAESVKELAARERQEIVLQEKRKHASGRAKKLKKSVQEDATSRRTALSIVENSTSKMNGERAKLDEHEASLEVEEKVLEGIRDSLKDKTQVFHDKIQVKQKELQPWTAQINEKQAEIDVAMSERDALSKKAESLRAQSKEANEVYKALLEERENKVSKQNSLKAEKTQLQRNVQTAESKLIDAQKYANEIKAKAATARAKIDEAKANQSENRSRNNVLDSLTRLKDGGNNEGFHGRLGSLGTIPDKYDVAISTACGGQLNYMVVDRVTQAQTCIEYLRKNNVGRASFMVLEKLGKVSIDSTPTPENVPRLYDLVKPKDPSYAPAFQKAIGSTLVANDVEQANRIAFGSQKRWRVVTLDGAVIETSGAMSGGGGQPSRGAMSSKFAAPSVSPQVLQSYEKESDDAARQLQKALAELREAEVELERLAGRDPEIDLAYQKICMDIENMKRRITEAEKRAKDLSSQNQPNTGDLARISKLEKEISASQKTLESLKERSGQIEQDIKDLEEKILDIGGSKLLSQKSKVEGIRLHIGLANDEITKAEVAKAKAQNDAVKLESNITNNTSALEEVTLELETLEEQIAELMKYVSELKDKVDTAQAAAETSKEDLDSIKAKLDEQEDKIAQFRQIEANLKRTLQEKEKKQRDNAASIEHYMNEHNNLTLEEIDGDDDDEEEDPADNEGNKNEGEVKAEQDEGGESGQQPVALKKKTDATSSNELQVYTEDELRKLKKDELVADSEYYDEQVKRGSPDMTVLKEYKQREQEFLNRAKDLDAITSERNSQKATYERLRKQRLDEFMAGFNLISLKLKEMYQMITLGGNAELELVDSLDPFSEGIIFSVMPPKKSWKNISNLSGGEKTLSSLALVFALHVFKPTPLYFMDEIDAALDFRNVSIVANYIKDRTKNAQFIIISLRNDMFELSHRLIGIYKTSNATQSISIDNHALQSTIPHASRPLPSSVTTASALA